MYDHPHLNMPDVCPSTIMQQKKLNRLPPNFAGALMAMTAHYCTNGCSCCVVSKVEFWNVSIHTFMVVSHAACVGCQNTQFLKPILFLMYTADLVALIEQHGFCPHLIPHQTTSDLLHHTAVD